MAGHLVLVQAVGVRVPAPQQNMGKYVKKIFSGTSNPSLAASIANEMGAPLGNIILSRFSDGEIMVKYEENLREGMIFTLYKVLIPQQKI